MVHVKEKEKKKQKQKPRKKKKEKENRLVQLKEAVAREDPREIETLPTTF